MIENSEDNKFSFRTIWSICMFCIYMALAYIVAFTPLLIPYSMVRDGVAKEDDEMAVVRVILGSALFLYGIFRGYRLMKFKK